MEAPVDNLDLLAGNTDDDDDDVLAIVFRKGTEEKEKIVLSFIQ